MVTIAPELSRELNLSEEDAITAIFTTNKPLHAGFAFVIGPVIPPVYNHDMTPIRAERPWPLILWHVKYDSSLDPQ